MRQGSPIFSIAAIAVLAGVTLLGWLYMAMPSHAQVLARCPGLRSQPTSFDIPLDAYCQCWADGTSGFGNYLSRLPLSTANQDAWDARHRDRCQAAVTSKSL